MNYNNIKNVPVALLISNIADKNDVHVYLGEIINEGAQLVFINSSKKWRVLLNDRQVNQVKTVGDELKDVFLGAKYFIPLSVADLPDDNTEGLISTGINWKQ